MVTVAGAVVGDGTGAFIEFPLADNVAPSGAGYAQDQKATK